MRELYIVGAGGHGREILDVVEAINAVEPTWDFRGYAADQPSDKDTLARRGADVVISTEDLGALDVVFVLAIGDGEIRKHLDRQLGARDGASPSLVHPCASVADGVELADGALVPAGCDLGPGVRLGRHSTLNVNVSAGARCRLESYSTVSPGCEIGSDATLGAGAFLGVGAVVRSGVKVGAWSRVGAGALVESDVARASIVVGVPARTSR